VPKENNLVPTIESMTLYSSLFLSKKTKLN